jgi:hypothetical protein
MGHRIRDFVSSCGFRMKRSRKSTKAHRRAQRLTRGATAIETLEARSLLAVDLQFHRLYTETEDPNWYLTYSISGTPELSTYPWLKFYKSYDGTSLDELAITSLVGFKNQGVHTYGVIPPTFTETEDYYIIATLEQADELPPERHNNRTRFEGGIYQVGTVLFVEGGGAADDPDTVAISQESNLAVSLSNSSSSLVRDYSTAATGISEIRVRLHDGDDVVTAQPSVTKPMIVLAGEGKDSITGGAGADLLYGDSNFNTAASIVDRKTFYNQSSFDGNNAGHDVADDNAIAVDKNALLPGETATFKNYTSYSAGINGLMIDIANPRHTPTAADFAFAVGNTQTPSGWSPVNVLQRCTSTLSG